MPTVKVDLPVAGVLAQAAYDLVKYTGVDLQIPPVDGKQLQQGPAALINKKQENFDQIYANNLVFRREVLRMNGKKLK